MKKEITPDIIKKDECICNVGFGVPNVFFKALDCPIHNPIPKIPKLKNKHKGTHFACREIMESFGGKAWCCKCVGHSCLRPYKSIGDKYPISTFTGETKRELVEFVESYYEKGYSDAIRTKNLTISILMKEIDELKRKYVPRELDKTGTS